MSRPSRRLAVALVALIALAVAVDWAVRQASLEPYRANIERALSAALGRQVTLAGLLRLDLFPRPALELTEVVVASEPGESAPHLLRIEGLRLVLALRPLLQRRLQLVSLEADGADLRLEADAEGRLDLLPLLARLSGETAEPELPFAIRIDRIGLRDARVAWLDVETGGHTTLEIDALEFVARADDEPIEWSVHGSFRGGSFGFEGRGGTLAALLHPSGPWPLSLEGRAGEASVRLSGQIERPTRIEGLDLDLEIEVPDVGSLLAPGSARPGLGAARVRGHLGDPGGKAGLDRVAVESDPDAELRLRVQGSVHSLSDPSGIELDGEIEADRLRFLELLLERPLPEGRLQAKFRLSDRDGTLGVDGEAHAQSPDGKLRADLSGGFNDLRAVDALDARLRIAAPTLASLAGPAGLEWKPPALGPVVASARLRASAGAFGVEELALEAGRRDDSWVSLRGSLRDLRELRGVALEASVRSRSLASLGRMLQIARPLPDLGPLDLSAKLADARGPLAVERFQLRGGTPATVAFDFTGKVADLRAIDALDVEARVQARDAAVLGSLFGVELPPIGPAAFDGRAKGSDERLEANGTATLGQTRFEGRGSAEVAGRGRPRISAVLRSAHLRLEDLGLGPRGAALGRKGDRSELHWRGPSPLPFAELRRLDARLELRADRLTAGGSVDVRDARAALALEDGDLRIHDVDLEYQGGRIAGELRIDARTPDPHVALRADATALDLARLGVALGQAEATGSGLLDLALDLQSGGATPDALRQRLAGRAAFAARDWSAASELARRFLTDLTRAFLPEWRRAPERLGCFQGAVHFATGVASVETLVLAGQRATVVGAGSIDLVRERWNLELVPEAHDPRLLEVASAVRVTGPLAAPHFAPIPLDLVAGTLRGMVRGALLPARAVTAGAQRMLGPLGKILAPLHSGLGLGARAASAEAAPCLLPQPKPPDRPRP